jgi:hypothetical protein
VSAHLIRRLATSVVVVIGISPGDTVITSPAFTTYAMPTSSCA